MNHYFKKYLKDAALGAGTLSVVGAACGAAAGVVGLSQMCFMEGPAAETCENQIYPLIVPYAQNAAAMAGSTAGAAVGAIIGAAVYPAYQSFVRWCKRDQEEERNLVDVNNFRSASSRLV